MTRQILVTVDGDETAASLADYVSPLEGVLSVERVNPDPIPALAPRPKAWAPYKARMNKGVPVLENERGLRVDPPAGTFLIVDMDGNPRLSYMDQREYDEWRDGNVTTTYADFTIKPKRDFGLHGFHDPKMRGTSNVKEGWIVVQGGCLATPGGVWAHTKEGAMQMIDVMKAVGIDSAKYEAPLGQRFHHLLRAINRTC